MQTSERYLGLQQAAKCSQTPYEERFGDALARAFGMGVDDLQDSIGCFNHTGPVSLNGCKARS